MPAKPWISIVVFAFVGCGGTVESRTPVARSDVASTEHAMTLEEMSEDSARASPPNEAAGAPRQPDPSDEALTQTIGPIRTFAAERFRMRFPREIVAGDGPTAFTRASRPNADFIVTFVDLGADDPLSFERLREFVERNRNGRTAESEIEVDLGGRRALRTHYASGGASDLRQTVISLALGTFAFQVVAMRPHDYPDDLAEAMARSLERVETPNPSVTSGQ